MQVQRIQTANQTTFGTKFGKNLDEFIRINREGFTTRTIINISHIKKNNLNDTILELEPASPREQKMFNFIYKINLHSDTIDRKNQIMSSLKSIPRIFQEFARGRLGGKKIITDNIFPIFITNLGRNTWIDVAENFKDGRLAEKIEEEVRQSRIVVDEFDKFEKNYLSRLNRKAKNAGTEICDSKKTKK